MIERTVPTRRFPLLGGPSTGSIVAALLGSLLIGACRPGVEAANEPDPGTEPETRRARMARVIEEYDAQGIHRTGTEVDDASARWLADRVRAAGFEPELEPVPFDYSEVTAAWLELPDGTRLEGVPLLDSPFTGAESVAAPLRALGDGTGIGFAAVPPNAGGGPELLEARKDAAHGAILAVTGGATFGLPEGYALINADRYLEPYGPPVLQLPSETLEQLSELDGQLVKVVIQGRRVATEVLNVTVTVPGTDPELPPMVVMTPRSGWWSCASERGGGLAVWVELLYVLRQSPPRRTVHFVASTGHELGHIGLDHYLAQRQEMIPGAHLWLHLGANFAAAVEPGVRLQASSQALLDEILAGFAEQGLEPQTTAPVGERPLGEARNVFDAGGSYVSILGRNGLFHHPTDRWPEAVDLDRLERLTTALSELTVSHTR